MCHYRGPQHLPCVADEHLWQIYISVISHDERAKYLRVFFYIEVSLILTLRVGRLSVVCNSCLGTFWHSFIPLVVKL